MILDARALTKEFPPLILDNCSVRLSAELAAIDRRWSQIAAEWRPVNPENAESLDQILAMLGYGDLLAIVGGSMNAERPELLLEVLRYEPSSVSALRCWLRSLFGIEAFELETYREPTAKGFPAGRRAIRIRVAPPIAADRRGCVAAAIRWLLPAETAFHDADLTIDAQS